MDLGSYLARRSCAHVFESAGGSGSVYVRGLEEAHLFTCNSARKSYSIWHGYRLSYHDDEFGLRVVLERGELGIPDSVAGGLEALRIPQKYRDVIAHVEVCRDGKNLVMRIVPSGKENSSDRTQNKDKLFFAVHNCVNKPVYSAVLNKGMR